ncbi:MAG: hypothetical protein EOO43_20305 [Flavobacterium sp.]|nr:MAG: hypothetical protein EOO43_20305 [Flavobacterium sp.]
MATSRAVGSSNGAWKTMKKSRDLTSHSYDGDTADDIAENIIELYYGMFIQLETRLQLEKINEEKNLFN